MCCLLVVIVIAFVVLLGLVWPHRCAVLGRFGPVFLPRVGKTVVTSRPPASPRYCLLYCYFFPGTALNRLTCLVEFPGAFLPPSPASYAPAVAPGMR